MCTGLFRQAGTSTSDALQLHSFATVACLRCCKDGAIHIELYQPVTYNCARSLTARKIIMTSSGMLLKLSIVNRKGAYLLQTFKHIRDVQEIQKAGH